MIDRSSAAVERAGIDVPGVVILRRVFEGLELVAAGVWGERFVVRTHVEEAGDAAGLLVDGDAQVVAFSSEMKSAGLVRRYVALCRRRSLVACGRDHAGPCTRARARREHVKPIRWMTRSSVETMLVAMTVPGVDGLQTGLCACGSCTC